MLAKDVADWIEHSNSRMMLQSVDEEEKLCVNNPYALKGLISVFKALEETYMRNTIVHKSVDYSLNSL